MHDERFPASDEPVSARSARAVTALEYEESAGLGMRRPEREVGVGNPHSGDVLGADETTGQLVGAYFAAVGVVLGLAAFVYLPLVTGFLGFLCALIGTSTGGTGARIGKVAFIILGCAVLFGLGFAVYDERPLY